MSQGQTAAVAQARTGSANIPSLNPSAVRVSRTIEVPLAGTGPAPETFRAEHGTSVRPPSLAAATVLGRRSLLAGDPWRFLKASTGRLCLRDQTTPKATAGPYGPQAWHAAGEWDAAAGVCPGHIDATIRCYRCIGVEFWTVTSCRRTRTSQ